jgi:hypothetical protein
MAHDDGRGSKPGKKRPSSRPRPKGSSSSRGKSSGQPRGRSGPPGAGASKNRKPSSGRPASTSSSSRPPKPGASRSGSGASKASASGSPSQRPTSKPTGGSSRSNRSKGDGTAPRTGVGPPPKKKVYSATTRSVEEDRRKNAPKRRRDLKGAAVNLPNWVIESVERVTPADRIAPTLEALGAASEALADGKYHAAVKHGNRAKALSPQDPTTRETIGIAAYRMGDWQTALTELRAFRRMQGDTTHLPVEMDVLRAQGRKRDVEAAWNELQRRGGHGLVMNEGKVVYGSFLLDEGRPDEAWEIVNPGRVVNEPNEAHLRLYFVAARTAAARGDRATARNLADTIVMTDPSFPGFEQLEAEIARIT